MKFLVSLLLLAATALAAQPYPLPRSASLIALGHDIKTHPLQKFADRLKGQLDRQVVTYRQFEEAHYTSETGKWWDRLSYDQTTSVVEQAIRRAVDRYPDSKIIAFDLDGYNPSELLGPDGAVVRSYTNFEVCLLLRDRRLFSATRWYRDGKELSSSEANDFWAPVIERLRSKQCLLHTMKLLK